MNIFTPNDVFYLNPRAAAFIVVIVLGSIFAPRQPSAASGMLSRSVDPDKVSILSIYTLPAGVYHVLSVQDRGPVSPGGRVRAVICSVIDVMNESPKERRLDVICNEPNGIESALKPGQFWTVQYPGKVKIDD